ncbi:MAG: T9SS type A sorting domain-containing protein [Bacteroidales bacterium]|nr:T9SS type A sorting domain-containing protein [Bacteroidales bacterium]
MKLLSTTLLAVLLNIAVYSQTVVFSEDFESIVPPALPSGWTQEKVVGSSQIDWESMSGGHQGNPASGYNGSTYNAIFQYQSYNNEATRLITPSIDIADIIKPELRFGHAQDIWWDEQDWWDRLKVYYKRGEDSSWVLLEEYLLPVTDWTARNILLPDSSISSTYYIGFEGITGYGHGVCIDEIQIVETGIIAKYLSSITIKQTNSSFIPTGTTNNPIMRIDLVVEGNDGTLILDSLAVKTLNTSDDDLEINGLKIYATDDTIFSTTNLLASGNFNSGIGVFDNLNYDIPRKLSSIWITYDIKEDLSHEMHGHIADVYIEESGIKINNYLYPFADKSPEASRTIYESVFIDNFETDKGWRLTGEFERAIPLGLFGANGNADPEEAYSGSYVLGTDLTDDGLYANGIADTAYVAELPTLNFKYYKDIYLTYYRWLNVDFQDYAKILGSSNGTDWTAIWSGSGFYTENSWYYKSLDISSVFERQEIAKLKYTLGETGAVNAYTGWNIEDVIIIGNYISKDVGITEWIAPLDGCGHTSEEYVEVKIQNYAGELLNDPLPVSYSFDDGETISYDTIINPNIAIDDFIVYQIDKPIDLTVPGWYNNVYATTHLAGDEDNTNNRIDTTIFITPTYSLPYYEDFETNYGYYLSGGTNSSWEYGEPNYIIIDAAASGTKAWVTNPDGLYSNNDSSYLLSPCFNFSGSDSIVFEFKCKGISEDKTDGLSLLYSLNEGTSWNIVPDDGDFYWNWYTEANISDLELPGIDTTNGEWLSFRQLLPLDVMNQSSVKFKFVFESNETNNYEGFGIDDIRIYNAPVDVGISSISEPVTDCEIGADTEVKVYVENYGINTIKSGTKIPLTLEFNSDIINDTLTLASDLLYGNNVLFTFGTTVDMSYAGDFGFTVYTKLENNTYFYNETVSNDTLSTTISVTGMPNYNPFEDIVGGNPITDITLDAEAGYDTYAWLLPPPDNSAATQTWDVTQTGMHYVTVTNLAGCSAQDSIEIVSSLIDLTMDVLYTETADSCERNLLTELSVRFINNGISVISDTDTVLLGYQINNNPVVEDTLFVSSEIGIGGNADFTYNEKCDLKTPGAYTVKVFTNVLKDLNHADDTVTSIINTNGYVDVNLNYDTAYTSQADTLDLVATAGYLNYIWNTAETNDSIKPPNNLSNWFYVTVTDNFACGSDSDSVFVQTYDFGINSVINPVSDCGHTTTEPIQVSIHNYSGNTYLTGTKIPFRFDFNGAGWVNDTVTLASDLGSGIDRTLTLTNTVDPNIDGSYSFVIELNSEQDANSLNDSFDGALETYGYPTVSLPYDTIFTTSADTVELIVQSGFKTYNWSDGSSGSNSLSVSDNFSKKYKVTVTDMHDCITSVDSTHIITYNVGINAMVSPTNACENSANENVTITIKNYSLDILYTDTVIPVGYILEGEVPVVENFTLEADLGPSQTVNYTFADQVDVSLIKTHKFKLFTAYNLDVNTTNDTLIDAIKTFGFPDVEIGDDILTTQPDTVSIVAPGGFNAYNWSDGTVGQTLNVTYLASKEYTLTVADVNGCTTTDYLNIYTYNVTADSINSPVVKCDLTTTETVIIGVINNGADTLQIGEQLEVGYLLNSDPYVSELFNLTEILYPDSTSLFTLSGNDADLTENKPHEFNVFAKLTSLDVDLIDTTTIIIDHPKPDLDLGETVNTANTEYVLDAGSGYVIYEWFDESDLQTYTVDINTQTLNNYYAVTVTNDLGCVASDSVMVIFDITPDLGVTVLKSPVSECWQSGKTYQVEITIENLGEVNITSGSYLDVGYRIGNGPIVLENTNLSSTLNASTTIDYTFADDITFDAAGDYEFKPFVKLGGDENAVNDTLSDNPIEISQPVVDMGSDTVRFSDSYEIIIFDTYSSYLWSTGDTTPTITVTETDTYTVTVTDALGCQGMGEIYCEKITGIDNLIKGEGYKITYYPNPVSESLSIILENEKSTDVVIEIININGQILYNNKLSNVQNTTKHIDVNPYANGIYYIRFRIDDKYYLRKLIIQ